MRHVKGERPNGIGRTDAGRVCVKLVGSSCVERNELFPGIKDKRVVGRGLSVLADREEGERDRPITPQFCQHRAIIGVKERTRWFDCPFPQQVQTQGICPDERGFHPRLR